VTSDMSEQVTERLAGLGRALDAAQRARSEDPSPGQIRARADAFVASAVQHLTTVTSVLLPEAARLPDSKQSVRDVLDTVKALERALVVVKARVYGQAQNAQRPWDYVWGDARDCLAEFATSELALVTFLDNSLDSGGLDRVQTAMSRAVASPTRPHPYLPHLGLSGRMARRLCVTIDRIWDELEGRVTSSGSPAP